MTYFYNVPHIKKKKKKTRCMKNKTEGFISIQVLSSGFISMQVLSFQMWRVSLWIPLEMEIHSKAESLVLKETSELKYLYLMLRITIAQKIPPPFNTIRLNQNGHIADYIKYIFKQIFKLW